MKIITTVGTSFFANAKKKKIKINRVLETPYKSEYFDSEFSSDPLLKEYILPTGKNRTEIKKWARKEGQNASAEIASILKIQEGVKKDTKLAIYLVCTETILSRLAAEYIEDYFEQDDKRKHPNIKIEEIYVVPSLKVDNQTNYDEGFSNLIEYLSKIGHKENDILNITGGYKALVPILTLYGQLEKLTLKYIYDDSSLKDAKLIELGQLPIHFDLSYIEKYVKFIIDPTTINNSTEALKLKELGLIKSEILPVTQLTPIGILIKNKLVSENLPFQKSFMGYFIEYKLYEYYQRNMLPNYEKVELGFKLSLDPEKELEDADLWFSNTNDNNVIAVEIKPASIKSKKMRTSKIPKMIDLIKEMSTINLVEFWVLVYDYEDNEKEDVLQWAKNVISNDLKNKYPNILFKVKKITIGKNIIDGNRNRMLYHEFMRSTIDNIEDIFEDTKLK